MDKERKPYLAGLTSFGVPPCGHPLFPSVFANVATQRDFIDKQLGFSENLEEVYENDYDETDSTTVSDATTMLPNQTMVKSTTEPDYEPIRAPNKGF